MLSERFTAHIKDIHPGGWPVNGIWLLAVSGGVDSVVLCDLAYKAGINFVIAHCNFQLRNEESTRDESFVRNLGEIYGKQVLVKHFDTNGYAEEHKKSIQVAARELRYNWFNHLLESTISSTEHGNGEEADQNKIAVTTPGTTPSLIVTAHHANDSIETLLMNFLKGTGISGLHGILPLQNKVFRPLLVFYKEELLVYATQHNLQYVEDSSNLADKYSRNYIRQHIMPQLKSLYPGVEHNLLSNIERFKEAEVLFHQSVDQHKKKLLEFKEQEVHIPVLKLAKTIPLRTIVYEIIKEYAFTASQADEVIHLLDSDSGKYVASATHRIIKNRKWLIISPVESLQAANILIEAGDASVAFDHSVLSIQHQTIDSSFKVPVSALTGCIDSNEIVFPLLLRKWKQGDYFYPLGMKKKKKLSRFFIDNKLSKSAKEKVWVIEMNKKIVWVVGQRIDDRFKVTPSTKSVLLLTCSL
ncbi:MAG: tRNA lysidine(34) synthetase TilS [Chitinophagaceae bacterium]|nr:tRNA lysidine(34) synthetase TilS [Chitinophagaceae bacterium]